PGIQKQLLQIFPDGIPVAIKGPTTKPQISYDAGEIQQRLTAGLTKLDLGSLIGGNKPGKKDDNPIGGLIDAVTGNKNKKPDPQPDEKMPDKSAPDDATRRPR